MAVQNGIDSKQALSTTSNVTFNSATLTTPLAGANGGTGVANTGSTITLGANLTTTPANPITLTTTGSTNVTLPTSGTLATTSQLITTPVSLANGGTNASLTANNGGIFYSTATAGAILSGTATANQHLASGASTTPSWTTATYPPTTTINQLLYSSAANTITGLATANSGVLTTSTTGVPSIDTTNFHVLTTGVQIKGNNTNTVSPVGFMGELISSTIASGSAVSLSTGVAKTVTSISVTAGNWMILGVVFMNTATTHTVGIGGISTTDNTLGTVWTQLPATNAAVGNLCTYNAPPLFVSLSGTTIHYLIADAIFSVGSSTAYGSITAVRIG